jgi:threonine/homoserine/homoserine lactone efflux protein
MQSVTSSLLAYLAAATVLVITPGLDTALVLRTAATEGSRRAVLAALGIITGCLLWTALVAAGLGALLAASQFAYAVLRWTGAAYLVLLGLHLLRHPRTAFVLEARSARLDSSAFSRGAMTNLLNPKVGVFYVSFLPQFVPHGVPVAPYIALLGAILALLGLVWFLCLISGMRPLLGWLRHASVIRALDRVTGGLFVSFGVGLALQARVSEALR